MKTNSITTMKE